MFPRVLRPGRSSTLNTSSVLYCTVLHCTALYYTVLYCTTLYCTVLHLNTSSLCSPGRKLWRWSSNWRSTAVWPEPWVKSGGDSYFSADNICITRHPSNIQESLKFLRIKRESMESYKKFCLQFKVPPSSLPCYQGTVSSTPPSQSQVAASVLK